MYLTADSGTQALVNELMAGHGTQARKLPRYDPSLEMHVVIGTYLYFGPGDAGAYRCCNVFRSHLRDVTAYAAASLRGLTPRGACIGKKR